MSPLGADKVSAVSVCCSLLDVYAGITLSKSQVKRGGELAAEQGLSNCSFQVMDALHMDFPDDTFDLVWACESGEHMPDKKKYIEEMTRVLKPGIVQSIACMQSFNPFVRLYVKSLIHPSTQFCWSLIFAHVGASTHLLRCQQRNLGPTVMRQATVEGSVLQMPSTALCGLVYRTGKLRVGGSVLERHGLSRKEAESHTALQEAPL